MCQDLEVLTGMCIFRNLVEKHNLQNIGDGANPLADLNSERNFAAESICWIGIWWIL